MEMRISSREVLSELVDVSKVATFEGPVVETGVLGWKRGEDRVRVVHEIHEREVRLPPRVGNRLENDVRWAARRPPVASKRA